MYPINKSAINPIIGTLGGVLGPIMFYYIFSAIFAETIGLGTMDDGAGAVRDITFADVTKGWAIPTATDISLAWTTAILVFGPGHPAITYLLVTAVGPSLFCAQRVIGR